MPGLLVGRYLAPFAFVCSSLCAFCVCVCAFVCVCVFFFFLRAVAVWNPRGTAESQTNKNKVARKEEQKMRKKR